VRARLTERGQGVSGSGLTDRRPVPRAAPALPPGAGTGPHGDGMMRMAVGPRVTSAAPSGPGQ